MVTTSPTQCPGRRIVLTLLLILTALTAYAEGPGDWEQGLAVRGIFHYQRFPTAFEPFQPGFQRDTATLQSLTRLWLKRKTERLTTKFEIETNALLHSSPMAGNPLGGWGERRAGDARIGFWNLSKNLRTRERGEAGVSIERADLAWSWGSFDLDLGRQPISLGTSHFIGLLDVLAPFHPGYLDASYKPGIDALRVRTGFGTSGEAEIIAVPGGWSSSGALLGRFRKNLDGFDLELIGGRFRGRGMVGLGYDGERRRITYWGEVAAFEHDLSRELLRGGNSRWAVSFITGVEKEIRPKLRMGAAFLHQDFGTRHASELPGTYADAPFREGWTFLGGRSYAVLTVQKEFSPLIKGDLNGMFNLADGSTLWQPKLVYNTSDNSDLSLFAWIPTGRQPTATAIPFGPSRLETPGEFGLFPAGLGLILRRFF